MCSLKEETWPKRGKFGLDVILVILMFDDVLATNFINKLQKKGDETVECQLSYPTLEVFYIFLHSFFLANGYAH